MSYIVFARKYRPQNFDEVAGQEYVTRTLKNAVESKRIAHAYLFSGPRGVGKTSIARILAKAINCTDMKDNNPCGKCNSCMEITEGNSPDIIEIDGASNRGIDEIRDLRDKVKFLPVKNKFKVYIIDEVHMLTNEAFNALLKTLEEPPEHVIFIFATTDMIKVPLTVASRCQKFSFRKLTAAEIAAHLKTILNKEKIEIDPKVISLISRNSDGALRDAESLLDQVISFSAGEVKLKDVQELVGTVDNTKILGIVSAASKKETESALKIINELYDIGVDTFLFIKHLAEYFRNILISKMVKDPADFMDMADPEEMAVFLSFSKEFSVSDISNIIKILTDLLEKLKYSAYPRAIIEVAVIKITRMDRLLDISEIYKAIDCSTDHTEKKTELEPKRGIKSSPDYTVAQPAENTLKITDIEDIEIEGVQGQEKIQMVKKNWLLLSEKIREKKRMLSSCLLSASPSELSGNVLVISVKDDYSRTVLEMEANRNIIKEDFFQMFRMKIEITIKKEDAGSRKVEENMARQSYVAQDNAAIEPIVKTANEIFGGRIMKKQEYGKL